MKNFLQGIDKLNFFVYNTTSFQQNVTKHRKDNK